MRITHDNTIEYETHKFVTNASDLGLPPGKFPLEMETDLGNGMSFIMASADGENAIKYIQRLGCITLTVIND